jgi:hypothetical protein
MAAPPQRPCQPGLPGSRAQLSSTCTSPPRNHMPASASGRARRHGTRITKEPAAR